MFSGEETKTDQNTEPLKEKKEEEEEKDLEALYEATMGKSVTVGSVITGRVIHIGADNIMIDIGRKIEGQAPIKEFLTPEGNIEVAEGDKVDVLVERINTAKGLIRLSREKAKRLKVWEDIIQAYQEKTPLRGKVIERVKGGFTVDLGIPAFMPASQTEIKLLGEKEMDALIGTEVDVDVIKYNRRKNNVVVSHREVLEKQRDESKKKLLETLKKGDVLKGTVKNIMAYGAFVDIGGIDGLLHITDMSWGKLKHPSEKVNPGDVIDVKVLEFDPETEKISLGIKQLTEDPWKDIEYRYPIGKKVHGKVTSITNYGAFVELEEGVEGLVHISEMFWTKRLRHPSSVVKEGQEVDVVVLGVDIENRRISLGLKQTLPNPWDLLAERYPPGTVVDAKVKNITDFGIFVSVDEDIDIDGLIHISDISWDTKVNLKELFKRGDSVKAKVLTVDPETEKFSLSIKQLSPDPWEEVAKEYPVGSLIKGKVTSITEFGAFVEIKDGIEGMVHISEVSKNKISSIEDVLEVGQEVEALVLRISPENKKIGLSIKALEDAQAKKEIKEKEPNKVSVNLGHLIKEQLKDNKRKE